MVAVQHLLKNIITALLVSRNPYRRRLEAKHSIGKGTAIKYAHRGLFTGYFAKYFSIFIINDENFFRKRSILDYNYDKRSFFVRSDISGTALLTM